jgi:hypothetical protein
MIVIVRVVVRVLMTMIVRVTVRCAVGVDVFVRVRRTGPGVCAKKPHPLLGRRLQRLHSEISRLPASTFYAHRLKSLPQSGTGVAAPPGRR